MKNHKVYALTEPDNKETIRYIGVTKRRLMVRLGQHLMKMDHRSTRRDEWLKSLSKAPQIILLYSFDTSSEAYKKEKELITQFKLKGVVLFNEQGNFKRRWKNQKPVYQYNLKGKLVAEYESAGEAAVKNLFMKYKCINACCNGSKKTHHGFMFSFEKKTKIKPFKKLPSVQGKKVYQYDIEGNFISEFINGPDAERKTGVLNGDIWKVCNNYKNAKTAGGFKWSYDKV